MVHRPPLAALSGFVEAAGFTVSILGAGHKSVSPRLARPGEHSAGRTCGLVPTELGPPALTDALAVFECAGESVQDAGDHAILIGRVLRFARNDGGARRSSISRASMAPLHRARRRKVSQAAAPPILIENPLFKSYQARDDAFGQRPLIFTACRRRNLRILPHPRAMSHLCHGTIIVL